MCSLIECINIRIKHVEEDQEGGNISTFPSPSTAANNVPVSAARLKTSRTISGFFESTAKCNAVDPPLDGLAGSDP